MACSGWRLLEIPTAVYALDFHPDGKSLAVAGADGMIRIVDVEHGTIQREFAAVPTIDLAAQSGTQDRAKVILFADDQPSDELPDNAQIASLAAEPAAYRVVGLFRLRAGRGRPRRSPRVSESTSRGWCTAHALRTWPASPDWEPCSRCEMARRNLQLEVGGQSVVVPVSVSGLGESFQPDYLRDVVPVMAKLGCNQGTCHGAAQGKNGFKLSLRGYDAIADLRAFTDDHASRRANTASPDDSLMLLKATATVPHMGGHVMKHR